MHHGETNVNRLKGRIWGDSMLNKLPSLSRKRRKRAASKARRVNLAKRLQTDGD